MVTGGESVVGHHPDHGLDSRALWKKTFTLVSHADAGRNHLPLPTIEEHQPKDMHGGTGCYGSTGGEIRSRLWVDRYGGGTRQRCEG